jgi:hypothetical protein
MSAFNGGSPSAWNACLKSNRTFNISCFDYSRICERRRRTKTVAARSAFPPCEYLLQAKESQKTDSSFPPSVSNTNLEKSIQTTTGSNTSQQAHTTSSASTAALPSVLHIHRSLLHTGRALTIVHALGRTIVLLILAVALLRRAVVLVVALIIALVVLLVWVIVILLLV